MKTWSEDLGRRAAGTAYKPSDAEKQRMNDFSTRLSQRLTNLVGSGAGSAAAP